MRNTVNCAPQIDRSSIVDSPDVPTIFDEGRSSDIAKVGTIRLAEGSVFQNSDGVLTCAGVYDEVYDFFPSACP